MTTTKADFELFKEYASKWQVRLGLVNWALYYEHTKLENEYARTHWSVDAMAATIQLSTYWDNLRPKTEQELDRLALHEVLHVLMAPICREAEYRFSTQDAISAAEHSIIRSLENIVV